MKLASVIASLYFGTPVSAGFLDTQREDHIVPMPMHSFPQDCGTESKLRVIASTASLLQQDIHATSSVQQDNVPGAGIDQIYNATKFQAFKTVLKDGYMLLNCVKDDMYYTGDKYGDNKHDYKLGGVSRVSIVHYDAFVARKDRVEMTPTVCFEFCRTVPNMGFFGITNGRSCYCTPYFQAMASDSSPCDAVCEGDRRQSCGSKAKSSIFVMHMCASTGQDLLDLSEKAGYLYRDMAVKLAEKFYGSTFSDLLKGDSLRIIGQTNEALGEFMKQTIDDIRESKKYEGNKVENAPDDIKETANLLKSLFGFVGDSGATDLAQSTKIYAQNLLHMGNDVKDLAEKLAHLYKDLESTRHKIADEQKKSNSKTVSHDLMTAAETTMSKMEETIAASEAAYDKLVKNLDLVYAKPTFTPEKKALPAYVPVMYFIDKKFDGIVDPDYNETLGKLEGSKYGAPTTCTGDLVGTPIIGKSAEECAQACDDQLVNGCKAFQYFRPVNTPEIKEMCFLFSKFKTGVYYTGCKTPSMENYNAKLDHTNKETGCWAKFSKFAGGKFDGSGTLKPGGFGPGRSFCKECFKTFTKADRCYTAELAK